MCVMKVMELTAFAGSAFYTLQIQGLACLVMGACIMSDNEAPELTLNGASTGPLKL